MRSGPTLALLDRLEIILEALSTMPGPHCTEEQLACALRARGERPPSHAERRALAALGRDLAPGAAR
ncbi:MAG: hypothetical protein LBD97_05120 [Bifidobacteriaceae bacterium]|jgi:hypothetical protein|nr:hypothetical protein [Bifidobacteriaceae bacterium]